MVVGTALIARWQLAPVVENRVAFLLTIATLMPLPMLVRPGAFLVAAFVAFLGTWFLFLAPGGFATASDIVAIAIYAVAVAATALTARLAQRMAQRLRSEIARADQRLSQLELVTNAMPALISYIDRTRTYRFANDYYEEWFGTTREQVIGKTMTEVLGPAAVEKLEPHMDRAFAGDHVRFEMEVPYRRGGGRWVDVQYVPDHLTGVGVVGVFVLVLDVTERRRVAHAMEEQKRIAEALYRAAGTLASELDVSRLTQRVTDEAVTLVGAEWGAFYGQVPGSDALELDSCSGAPRAAFPARFSTTAADVLGFGDPPRPVLRSADVARDWLPAGGPPPGAPTGGFPSRSYLAVPVVSRSGTLLGGLFFGHARASAFDEHAERLVVGIATQAAVALDNARLFSLAEQEIRERKQIESALRAREAELEETDRRKDEFLAILSHELRNPLAPIRTAVEVLKMTRADERRPSALAIIERQASHLSRLVDDLLDVGRITRGQITLQKRPVRLGDLLREVVDNARAQSATRGIELRLTEPVPDVVLDADPTRIAQVVGNLLNNAIKYTDPGGQVDVTAEVRPSEVVIAVRDTGIGIAPQELPHVFDMFTQAKTSVARSQGGLGIGLSLTRSLVELHGGAIEASSAGLGRGSEFRVRLPLETPSSLRSSVAAAAAPDPVQPPEDRRTVLVVDDNEDVLSTVTALLELHGHDVWTAADGEAALRVAAEVHPDLLLLDIGLPLLDGYEVARRIRRQPWGKSLRIVAMTGWGQDKDRLRSAAAGFDVHLTKPAAPEVLESLIRACPRA